MKLRKEVVDFAEKLKSLIVKYKVHIVILGCIVAILFWALGEDE